MRAILSKLVLGGALVACSGGSENGSAARGPSEVEGLTAGAGNTAGSTGVPAAGATGSAGTMSTAGTTSNAGTTGNAGATGAAGATNNAGTMGAAGNSAAVLPCDDLPPAGMWQDVTPPGMSEKPAVNGTVGAAIIVDPFDARTVWLGTGSENDEIWRSNDCGATWEQTNTGSGGVGDGMTVGGVGDGAQWSMQIDPVDSGVLYATSGYGAQGLWKTIDGGTSWVDVLADTEYAEVADYRFVNNVSMDPTDHLHLVVSTHGACQAPYDPSCIAETKDGGDSWSIVTAPEGWVEGGGLIIVQGDLWVWCGTSLMVTTNAGESWSSDALAGGGSCEAEYTIRPFVPASNGNYYLGSRNGMLRSSDGAAWEHIPDTNGFMVMVTQGSDQVFAANQWQPVLWSANLDEDDTWTEFEAPAQIAQGSDGGIPFLAYDDAHHILFASMFSGGVARMVVP